MKIEVKRVDILRGATCSPYGCPIALAFYRALPGLRAARVLAAKVEIRNQWYTLPRYVTDFIQRFDDSTWSKRKKLKPFSFTVRRLRP